jgi:hypothetical protein
MVVGGLLDVPVRTGILWGEWNTLLDDTAEITNNTAQGIRYCDDKKGSESNGDSDRGVVTEHYDSQREKT